MSDAQTKPPRFSVITPSLNQGRYIETTIQSVLSQDFGDFEHFVIDGGSVDETISILKTYPHLKWFSGKDKGQSEAINKGLRMATGEIIAWVNSDDWYAPNTFKCVDEFFAECNEAKIVMGNCQRTNQDGEPFEKVINHARGFKGIRKFWINHAIPTQPAIFFKRQLLLDHGYLDESLHYAMDFDLWLRFARFHHFFHVNKVFAYYRFHPDAKGGTDDWSHFVQEWRVVYERHVGLPMRLYDWLPKNVKRIETKIRRYLIQKLL